MVRSAPKERVSNHGAAPSFETIVARFPQDEAGRVHAFFLFLSPNFAAFLSAALMRLCQPRPVRR
jgi:hypothetical protein